MLYFSWLLFTHQFRSRGAGYFPSRRRSREMDAWWALQSLQSSPLHFSTVSKLVVSAFKRWVQLCKLCSIDVTETRNATKQYRLALEHLENHWWTPCPGNPQERHRRGSSAPRRRRPVALPHDFTADHRLQRDGGSRQRHASQ